MPSKVEPPLCFVCWEQNKGGSASCPSTFLLVDVPPEKDIELILVGSMRFWLGDSCVTEVFSAYMTSLALSELLGQPVFDAVGAKVGRVREVAMVPQEDSTHVALLVVRTESGDRLLATRQVQSINGGIRSSVPSTEWAAFSGSEGMLLMDRDLLDQQIIDVHGRKVVRVNDVELQPQARDEGGIQLRIGSVDVGARGAVRRLLKGIVPSAALRTLVEKIPPRPIPWEFVSLIETDPARRVHLKIASDRLAKLHPADLADIIEDLAPSEREAVFQSLPEGTAAA